MLSTEQIKQIAEYMDIPIKIDGDCVLRNHGVWIGHVYDPELHSKDCFELFKALVAECKKSGGTRIIINASGNLLIHFFGNAVCIGEFNNESICLAYIAVMQREKG